MSTVIADTDPRFDKHLARITRADVSIVRGFMLTVDMTFDYKNGVQGFPSLYVTGSFVKELLKTLGDDDNPAESARMGSLKGTDCWVLKDRGDSWGTIKGVAPLYGDERLIFEDFFEPVKKEQDRRKAVDALLQEKGIETADELKTALRHLPQALKSAPEIEDMMPQNYRQG